MSKSLKGGEFVNRYRITGTLKTLAPLHIGTGEESSTRLMKKEAPKAEEPKKEGKGAKSKEDVPKVSAIIKDYRGKPMIPGSSLRGVMRHWLLDVFRGFRTDWANVREYEDDPLLDLEQQAQIERIKREFSLLELVFGTPFNAGKVEVWDALCLTEDLSVADTLLCWDKRSLTYVDTSVAIDPDTGTAMDKLLYQAEVVPPGVTFGLTLAGQNLADDELGLVLLALQGFNSQIYPISVGARSGRGYGRLQFIPDEIYYLDKAAMGRWIADTVDGLGFEAKAEKTAPIDDAGYLALPRLDKSGQQALIGRVKAQLRVNGGG